MPTTTMNEYERPLLDVKEIIEPILRNFDEHVWNFIRLLESIQCKLMYEGPLQFRDYIRFKGTYSCSVEYFQQNPLTSKRKVAPKCLRNIFPVMIGSRLDTAIRKLGMRQFSSLTYLQLPYVWDKPFEEADYALTCFLVNGILRRLPHFFTNDPTNVHVIRNSIVRCYTYDANDRGKELSFYIDHVGNHQRGDMVVVLNNGSETNSTRDFFDHCPYAVDQVAYMFQVYKEGQFDIDHLANKIFISPGHLFVRLFVKYLFNPLRQGQWPILKSKLSMVVKSIETGHLLHVLSRKTLYFKESGLLAPKMVSVPQEQYRELGMNGEVYVEKNTGCYRDVTMQTLPFNIYLSHLVLRQISDKVKKGSQEPYNQSYFGFLCILGCLDTKDIGRTGLLVRNTYISTCDDMDPVAHAHPGEKLYAYLNLQTIPAEVAEYYVVVNEASIPVTEHCFKQLNLLCLKIIFCFIECYQREQFIYIRYKAGLLFREMSDIWVTVKDEAYWAHRFYHWQSKKQLIDKCGFQYLTSYLANLNPYWKHNVLPKNLLGMNQLRNAVLATNSDCSRYFMESVSAYSPLTPYHEAVCKPIDALSARFVLWVPRVTVAYMSVHGENQEDCVVARKNMLAFDSYRIYTLRLKLETMDGEGPVVFYPVQGDTVREFLGSLVTIRGTLRVTSQSIHVKVVTVTSQETKLYFSKPGFNILEWDLTVGKLIVILELFHASSTGDKICSFHGQKGVMKFKEGLPILKKQQKVIRPDLFVSPYSAFRVTLGQMKESLHEGEGKDAEQVDFGDAVVRALVFCGKVFYFNVAYWSIEHQYTPHKKDVNLDKIMCQALKGRSRSGGMRIGTMEVMNCLRGSGMASVCQTKFHEHGDGILSQDVIFYPKSVLICSQDALFYKTLLQFATEKCMEEVEKKNEYEIE